MRARQAIVTPATPQPPKKTALTGSEVHALSNHLAVILGFIDLVLSQTQPDDPRHPDLIEIRNAAFEAARLIGRPIDDGPNDSAGKWSG
jgi:hypothetical protein